MDSDEVLEILVKAGIASSALRYGREPSVGG